MPAAAALILASAAGPYSMQVTAVLMVGLVLITAISPRTGKQAAARSGRGQGVRIG